MSKESKDVPPGSTEPFEESRALDHDSDEDEPANGYLKGFELASLVTALCLAVFCVALDNTIIATAVPVITDYFKRLQDVGWYASAYLFTTCAFQLPFGKIYSYYEQKWVFLVSLFIFEAGSLICALAKTSAVFIVGRAIAGFGGAGVLSGSLIIIARSVPLRQRANYTALTGAMFGVASVCGPLMGGALAAKVTWRWCFYINLPVGAVTTVVILVWMRTQPRSSERTSMMERILRLDPPGLLLFLPAIVCLLLAMQWGGTTYPWSSGRIIALLTLFPILLVAFVIVQIYSGPRATVPTTVAKQRSIAFGCLFAFCVGSSFFLFVFFVPYYFQAIKNVSALQSGINSLPLILAQVLGTIVAGALTSKLGFYMPFVYLSVVLMSVGAGLMTTWHVDTSTGRWVGYQLLYGFGVGCGFQQVSLAAQAVLRTREVPIGVALAVFVQLLGGAVFVSVGNNIFTNKLVSGILAANIPGVDPQQIIASGATELRKVVPAAYLGEVLEAYMAALVRTYRAGLVMSCLGVVGAAGMEWVDVRGKEVSGVAA